MKNVLVVGAPGSGKSHIIRSLADQAIERGDRVVLLCNKGDVARSFKPGEAILIGAHHARSHAWDMAADIEGAAGANQFAADIVPRSNPPFWSDSARLVLSDIIAHTIIRMGKSWTARDIIAAVLVDTDVMRRSLARLDLSASPLLQSSDPDGEDRTVSGIVLTMRSAVLATLRPLAWAWDDVPENRRFSIGRWLDADYKGRKTVILQFSPKLEAVSTLVIGGIMKRIARQLADPETPIDPKRRVVLALDEFDILGRVEDLGKALAVGREKGLSVIVGIQALSQLVATYGEQKANVLLDLFQLRIFGRLLPGEATERVSRMLGSRMVRAFLRNATPAAGDKRRTIAVDKEIRTFSESRLENELGVFKNAEKTGDVRALVHAYGQAFLLEWPFTTWRTRSRGYQPAKWVKRFPPAQDRDATVLPHRLNSNRSGNCVAASMSSVPAGKIEPVRQIERALVPDRGVSQREVEDGSGQHQRTVLSFDGSWMKGIAGPVIDNRDRTLLRRNVMRRLDDRIPGRVAEALPKQGLIACVGPGRVILIRSAHEREDDARRARIESKVAMALEAAEP